MITKEKMDTLVQEIKNFKDTTAFKLLDNYLTRKIAANENIFKLDMKGKDLAEQISYKRGICEIARRIQNVINNMEKMPKDFIEELTKEDDNGEEQDS